MGSVHAHQLMASQPESKRPPVILPGYALASEAQPLEAHKGASAWTWCPDVKHLSDPETEMRKTTEKTHFSWKATTYTSMYGLRELRVQEHDNAELVLEPGSEELLTWALRVGYQMLMKFSVYPGNVKSSVVMKSMCNIYDAVVSKRCMSYDLHSRIRGPDGRLRPASVVEHSLMCIVKCGLLRNTEVSQMRLCFKLWIEECPRFKNNEKIGSRSKNELANLQIESVKKFSEMLNSEMLSRTMKLLVESHQPEMLLDMLRDVGQDSTESLNEALRLAVWNDSAEIAASAFQMGAGSSAFQILGSRYQTMDDKVKTRN